MSNALAIATVTETLLVVLTRAIPASLVGSAVARALRPDDPFLEDPTRPPLINLFLYQVTPNATWRNADLPTRKSDGTPVRRPQAALDLHYLITFYGDDNTRQEQRLLGSVVRELHAHPVLDPADVATAEAVVDASAVRYADSHLSHQIERVRLTPINFSLEEMSKLWSVFLKTDYALSVAYVASVVLIETDDPLPASAPPVLEPVVFAVPLAQPVLDAVDPPMPAFAPNATVTLRGLHLTAPGNLARIDSLPTDIGPTGTPTTDTFVITLPNTLRAGVHQVRILQAAPLGAGHISYQSNPAFFVLRPILNSVTFAAGIFTADVSPPVGVGQQVLLVLNQINGGGGAGGSPISLTLPARARTLSTDPIVFDPSAAHATLPANTKYLARVRVDDAESLLTGGGLGPPPLRAPLPYTGPIATVP